MHLFLVSQTHLSPVNWQVSLPSVVVDKRVRSDLLADDLSDRMRSSIRDALQDSFMSSVVLLVFLSHPKHPQLPSKNVRLFFIENLPDLVAPQGLVNLNLALELHFSLPALHDVRHEIS